MCGVHPPQGQIGRRRAQAQRVAGFFGRAAVGLGTGPRRDVEAGARRRYRDGLVTGLQVRHAGQGARPLPVARHVHPKGAHQAEAGGSHHVRAAARREGPRARALRAVGGAGFGTHRRRFQHLLIVH